MADEIVELLGLCSLIDGDDIVVLSALIAFGGALLGVDFPSCWPVWGTTTRLLGDFGLLIGMPFGRCCPILEVGLDRLSADAGRDGGRIGLSIVKILDFLR